MHRAVGQTANPGADVCLFNWKINNPINRTDQPIVWPTLNPISR